MSCRFLFFILILVQECFSSVHISPNRDQLQYSFINIGLNRTHHHRARRTASDIFQIHIHYDTSVKK